MKMSTESHAQKFGSLLMVEASVFVYMIVVPRTASHQALRAPEWLEPVKMRVSLRSASGNVQARRTQALA